MNEGEEMAAAEIEAEAGTEAQGKSTLGSLFARLADDAVRLVRAEVELQRATLLHKAELARPALLAFVAFALLLQAALTTGLVMLAISLAEIWGTLCAALVVAGGALLVALLIGWAGLKRLQRLAGDEA